MSLFQFKHDEIITPYNFDGAFEKYSDLINNPNLATFRSTSGAVSYVKDKSLQDFAFYEDDQFHVFQIPTKGSGESSLLNTSEVKPRIIGSEENPDVKMHIEMVSFHLGKNEDVDKKTRATLRVNIGADENSSNDILDNVFWSIATGLNFYNDVKKQQAKPDEMKANFKKAFGNRPIEIPGGVCTISFDVVKHKEPAWWQRIFKFLKTETGQALTSTIGFPAVTSSAINMIDEVLNKLTNSDHKVLFKGKRVRLALSEFGYNNFTLGSDIGMGSLNQGFCVLTRGVDYRKIVELKGRYYANYDILIPSEYSLADILQKKVENPLDELTYAVLRVQSKETHLKKLYEF